MPFLITDSSTPLLMDTVPALKIREFNGEPARGEVYAYMRCYACKGILHLSFTEFDETPPDGVRMAMALMPADNDAKFIYLTVGKTAEPTLEIRNTADGSVLETLEAPETLTVTGSDEQGLYWCCETAIPKSAFDKIGTSLTSGSVFAGNVYLINKDEEAFGAAFKVPEGEPQLSIQGFDVFTAVPY